MVLESDFNERKVEDSHFSQEDLHFTSIIEEGMKMQEDRHCELPLPFKEDRTTKAVQNTDLTSASRKDLNETNNITQTTPSSTKH